MVPAAQPPIYQQPAFMVAAAQPPVDPMIYLQPAPANAADYQSPTFVTSPEQLPLELLDSDEWDMNALMEIIEG
jgi:hypothetical protein